MSVNLFDTIFDLCNIFQYLFFINLIIALSKKLSKFQNFRNWKLVIGIIKLFVAILLFLTYWVIFTLYIFSDRVKKSNELNYVVVLLVALMCINLWLMYQFHDIIISTIKLKILYTEVFLVLLFDLTCENTVNYSFYWLLKLGHVLICVIIPIIVYVDWNEVSVKKKCLIDSKIKHSNMPFLNTSNQSQMQYSYFSSNLSDNNFFSEMIPNTTPFYNNSIQSQMQCSFFSSNSSDNKQKNNGLNIPNASDLCKDNMAKKQQDYELELAKQRAIIENAFSSNRGMPITINVGQYSTKHDESYDMLPEIIKELDDKGYKYTYRYMWHATYAKYNEWIIDQK